MALRTNDDNAAGSQTPATAANATATTTSLTHANGLLEITTLSSASTHATQTPAVGLAETTQDFATTTHSTALQLLAAQFDTLSLPAAALPGEESTRRTTSESTTASRLRRLEQGMAFIAQHIADLSATLPPLAQPQHSSIANAANAATTADGAPAGNTPAADTLAPSPLVLRRSSLRDAASTRSAVPPPAVTHARRPRDIRPRTTPADGPPASSDSDGPQESSTQRSAVPPPAVTHAHRLRDIRLRTTPAGGPLSSSDSDGSQESSPLTSAPNATQPRSSTQSILHRSHTSAPAHAAEVLHHATHRLRTGEPAYASAMPHSMRPNRALAQPELPHAGNDSDADISLYEIQKRQKTEKKSNASLLMHQLELTVQIQERVPLFTPERGHANFRRHLQAFEETLSPYAASTATKRQLLPATLGGSARSFYDNICHVKRLNFAEVCSVLIRKFEPTDKDEHHQREFDREFARNEIIETFVQKKLDALCAMQPSRSAHALARCKETTYAKVLKTIPCEWSADAKMHAGPLLEDLVAYLERRGKLERERSAAKVYQIAAHAAASSDDDDSTASEPDAENADD